MAVAAVWSSVSRRPEHERLYDWLRVYVRFFLAWVMLGYAFQKLFKLQFYDLGLWRLTSTFGEASPMGLLWAFMGASTLYTVFSGGLEAIGACLLFFRRTTALGALILVAVLGNVVMMNFSYDVPVKLFSSHLWLAAVFLLLPDIPRLRTCSC